MKNLFRTFAIMLFLSGGFIFRASAQSSAHDFVGPAAVVPVVSEPAAKLIVDAPLASELAKARVVIQYRTENLRIVPVFGEAGLQISPRIGHLHITVDNLPWHWADASNEPIIIVGMTPGKHTILFEMADPKHMVLQRETVSFVVPDVKATNTH